MTSHNFDNCFYILDKYVLAKTIIMHRVLEYIE